MVGGSVELGRSVNVAVGGMGVAVGGMGVSVIVAVGIKIVGTVVGGGKGLTGPVGLLKIDSMVTATMITPTRIKTVSTFNNRVFTRKSSHPFTPQRGMLLNSVYPRFRILSTGFKDSAPDDDLKLKRSVMKDRGGSAHQFFL